MVDCNNGVFLSADKNNEYPKSKECIEMNDYSDSDGKTGLTSQQWFLLFFSFFLGVISVLTIDRVFLSETPVSAAVHAAVSQ